MESDVLKVRPLKTFFYEVSSQDDHEGNHWYIVRSGQNYVRLSEGFYRLFEGMNGRLSVGEVSNEIFPDGNKPDTNALGEFLAVLYRNELVRVDSGNDRDLLDMISGADKKKKQALPGQIGRKMIKSKLSFRNADPYITSIYNRFAKYLFSTIGLVLITFICLAGTTYFIVTFAGTIGTCCTREWLLIDNSYLTSLFVVAGAGSISLAIHEAAHALTCKHFGRTVTAFGFMIYYGAPAFFTDTTDCWMLPKRRRVAVDSAGMIANIFIGSVSILLIPVTSSYVAYQLCLISAVVNFLAAVANLVPFLKLDGYFILADLLDAPHLRENAIGVLFGVTTWTNLFRTRDERFQTAFTLAFGLGSVLFGGAVITYIILTIIRLIEIFVPPPRNIYLSALFAVCIVYCVATHAYKQMKIYRDRRQPSVNSLSGIRGSGQP